MKTQNIKQSVSFNCSVHDIYDALMNSKKHSKFTNSIAKIGKKVGDKFSVWDGDVHGINIELIPDEKIVQNWRFNYPDWPQDYFSKVIFNIKSIKPDKDNNIRSKILFFHTGIPEKYAKDIESGWKDYYWEPMKKMLEK